MQEFVIDLTSVCVRTGALQLPSKVLSRFEEGVVKVLAGGGEVDLTFAGPRTLSGLKPFFESQGLRANDRLRMEFGGPTDEWNLKVVAERRERTKPSEANAEPFATGLPAASGTMKDAKEYSPSSMVREVRKVRIGAQPPSQSHADARVASLTGNRPNRWASLSDSSPSRHHRQGEDDDALTTVRVVRRFATRESSDQPNVNRDGPEIAVKQTTLRADAVAPQQPVPPPIAIADEEDAGRVVDALPAPDVAGSERETLLPEILGRRQQRAVGADTAGVRATSPGSKLHRFGIRFWSDRSVAQPLKDPEDDLIADDDVSEAAQASGAKPAEALPRPSAALLLETEGEGSDEPQVVATAAASGNGRQAFDVFLGGDVADPDSRPSAIWRRAARTSSQPRQAPPEVRVASPPVGTDQRPMPLLEDRGVARPGDLSSQALARGEVRVAPLRSAALPRETQAGPGTASDVALRVEDAMEMINRYLMRPQTPAIVQTRTLADELTLEIDLAERAMERLSEDRDRFNRIRPGAYMVRRGALG